MVNILYTGNSKMFDGVLLNIISMVKRTNEEIHCYFFTADFTRIDKKYTPFSEHQANFLDSYLKGFNKDNFFKVINVDDLYNANLNTNRNEKSHYSPYATLRLLSDLVPEIPDKIIYLDCDTMCAGDVAQFNEVEIEGYEYAACKDYLGRFWINKNYINSGVLLLNMKLIRETGLFQKARDMVNRKTMEFPDQTPINKLYTSRIYFPDKFKFNEQRSVKEDTVIKHFCRGIKWFPFFHVYDVKQWDIEKVHKKLKIYDFDQDFEIYENLKLKYDKKLAANFKDFNKNYIIQVEHLVKSYGDVKAVNDISFNVKRGSLFAFLGANGAGKSTTINIITSILEKDSGKIYIDGMNLDKKANIIKHEIGIVFQFSVLDNLLTVEENLLTRAKFYNLTKEEAQKNLDEIITLLDLKPILNRQVKKLSGGQKRRVDIARSMIHKPKILVLDEPSTGLDPKTRADVWKLIDKIRKETNMTVFLTTHYLEEAEQASDVVIMDHGVIVDQGTPAELKEKYAKDYVLIYTKKSADLEQKFKNYHFKYLKDNSAYKVIIPIEETTEFLNKNKDFILNYEVKKGKMDDVFLAVTGMNSASEEDD